MGDEKSHRALTAVFGLDSCATATRDMTCATVSVGGAAGADAPPRARTYLADARDRARGRGRHLQDEHTGVLNTSRKLYFSVRPAFSLTSTAYSLNRAKYDRSSPMRAPPPHGARCPPPHIWGFLHICMYHLSTHHTTPTRTIVRVSSVLCSGPAFRPLLVRTTY